MPNRFKHPPEFYNITPDNVRKDIQGQRFGKLTVLGILKNNPSNKIKWVCKCDCGYYSAPFSFSLSSGDSRSCGCTAANKSKALWKTPRAEAVRKKLSDNAANVSHRLSKHPLYTKWADMKQRCTNERNKWYKEYGGRGIKVCDRWLNSFENFYTDMKDGYKKGLTIGRIDNDGNYEPSNCRWETAKQQQRNKSNTNFVDTPGGRMPIFDACEKYGLNRGCIIYRIKAGWPIDKIFSKPSERAK